MKRFNLVLATSLVAGMGVAAWVVSAQDRSVPKGLTFLGSPVTTEQIVLGQEVYTAHCAACHGENLEGQPDWRMRNDDGRMPAPPHDANGHTWHHSDRQLFKITKLGLSAILPDYESNMPAYEGILSDAEIAAVLAWIKSTWPERERRFQAEVTANDGGG